MPADLSAEQVEGDGNERHPGGGEKRQDALDSRRHEGAAARHVAFDPLLHAQVVEVSGVGHDQPGAGGERRPVGVDDVVVRQQRVDEEGERHGKQRDRAAPAPAIAHQTSIDIPSNAACTSVPMRWVRSAAISFGLALQTVIP